jgi:nucleoside-diphosphate-sugar epimerase
MTRDRVLVTGAAGRVAEQLIPGLDSRFDLRLFDRVGPDDTGSDIPLVVGELTDHALLSEALNDVDSVVHLAGNPDPDASWQELRNPNVEGFVTLLAAARQHGVHRVVFASSIHAMGAHEGTRRWPIDPAWPTAPCCAYGATKVFDEAMARVYAYQSDLALIGLRLGLCAPEASPAEAAAGWLRPIDLQRIVIGALTSNVRFGIYHALSSTSRGRWMIDATVAELGYEPEGEGGDELQQEPESPRHDEHLSTCSPRPQGLASSARV